MDKVTPIFDNLSRQINAADIPGRLNRTYLQARQFAAERVLGTADEITELPTEYRALEQRVDRTKIVYEQFLRVTQTFTKPQNDYSPPVQDAVADFGRKLGDRMTELAHTVGEATKLTSPGGTAAAAAGAPRAEAPATLGHALARTARECSETVGPEEALGAALKRFSQTMATMGDQKMHMDMAIVHKFYEPISTAYNTTVTAAERARRQVEASRLTYDACKQALKGAATPAQTTTLRQELEKAEDEFVKNVEEAMSRMKAVVDDPLPLRALGDFIQALLAYHKSVYEALAELSPEIDELNSTLRG